MPKKSVPKYRIHKASGQARVTLNNKTYYLGKYGTKKSWEKYYELIENYTRNKYHHNTDNKEINTTTPPTKTSINNITCHQLCIEFLDDNKKTLRKPAYSKYKSVIKTVLQYYKKIPVNDFAPNSLMFIQDKWVKMNYTKDTITAYSQALKNIFKWGHLHYYVKPDTLLDLKLTPNSPHDENIKENRKVSPVPLDLVEKTLPHLPQNVQDIIRLQLHTAARPQDICNMTKNEINTSQEIWIYNPLNHKTKHKNKTRIIPLGPNAQKILTPYLTNTPEHQQRLFYTKKDKPLTPNIYSQYIRHCCKKEKLPHWHPNQLRHTAATELRKRYGIENTKILLGHTSIRTTQIYAETDMQKALTISKEIG
jgi:integrase